jgi:hypothetical protein
MLSRSLTLGSGACTLASDTSTYMHIILKCGSRTLPTEEKILLQRSVNEMAYAGSRDRGYCGVLWRVVQAISVMCVKFQKKRAMTAVVRERLRGNAPQHRIRKAAALKGSESGGADGVGTIAQSGYMWANRMPRGCRQLHGTHASKELSSLSRTLRHSSSDGT